MKFVAKSTYTLGIKDATRRPEVSQSGVTTYVEVEPKLKATFIHRTLSHGEIEAAKAQILNNGGPYAFGSVPGRDEGNINIQDAAQEGYASTAHTGYDVYQNLACFDTNDPQQCPPEARAEVEQFLLNHYDHGNVFVRVDDWNLTPPWPTYPVSGLVNVEAVVEHARQAGSLADAIAFESSSAGRPELLVALQKADYEASVEREADAALSAQV